MTEKMRKLIEVLNELKEITHTMSPDASERLDDTIARLDRIYASNENCRALATRLK